MKQLNLLVWVTQLGLSIAVPFAGFLFLALWLRDRFGWGSWVLIVGILIGLITAADSFFVAMKAMQRSCRNKPDDTPPPVSFNDHH